MSRRLLLGLASLALVVAASGCAGPEPTGPSSPDNAAAFNEQDVMFAAMMVPHHEQAVEMADIVLDKDDVESAVLDLAERIKGAQAPEIERMISWLESWGGAPAGGGHSGHGDGMMSDDDVQTLRDAPGAQAGRLFLEQMIVHHEGALSMAEAQIAGGQNPDAVALAERIAESQAAEIQEMRDLLAAGQ